MGVPKFYRWISERYPCLSEVVKEYQVPEFDNLYLDMNGIIHVCSHPNDDDPHFRITEEQIFKDIFHYIEVLFRIVRPRKVFFMAVDGVAPRAKMNQQRGRRFRSAKEAEENIQKALKKGEVLPDAKRFDSNCITPGTKFMVKLQEQLEYMVKSKVTTDPAWQGIRIYLSGHETPGEGEHKITEFIRHERMQSHYDPNTRHCLYGLDADLMMLGLCSHEPHFSLLREEVRFTGKKNKNARTPKPEETTFHLLHLSLMREYIDHEFEILKKSIPFKYDLEAVIDDWVLMGFLVGNDFIPHLPHLHIAHNALPMLYKTYKEVLPTLDGYLNEGGVVNLARFGKYLETLAKFDLEKFEEHYADFKWLESKTGKKKSGKQPQNDVRTPKKTKKSDMDFNSFDSFEEGSSSSSRDMMLERKSIEVVKELSVSQGLITEEYDVEAVGQEEDSTFDVEFKLFKRNYYQEKLHFEGTDGEVAKIAYEYILAIQWICHYYYNGVQSWSWYYPYHYAPFLSDLRNLSQMKLKYEMEKPFFPYQQLLAVLPAASKECLPEPYWDLMCSEHSPIIDYYPLDFTCDLNGKQQEWEAVVLIPFINEERLLSAMEPCLKKLNKAEKERNQHSGCQLYTFDDNLDFYVKSSLAGHFPNIAHCKTKLELIPLHSWSTADISQFIKGVIPGCRLSVYYPGFPTLYHLPHSSKLEKRSVKVFQMPSRNENMILKVLSPGHYEDDIENPTYKEGESVDDVAKNLLGTSVYVNWPHMEEAKVVGVSDGNIKYEVTEHIHATGTKGSKHKMQRRMMSKEEQQIFLQDLDSLSESYIGRRGIDVGETEFLVYAQPLLGRKYVCGEQGQITLEKQWATKPKAYALQATVKDISVKDPTFQQFKGVDELFPAGSTVFMLGQPHYGCRGKVLEVSQGMASIEFETPAEPDIESVIRQRHKLSSSYYPGWELGSRLGVSSYLISRITGTIFVFYPANRKWQIGLSLRFSKDNCGIAGYTRLDNREWRYSEAVDKVLRQYMKNFPEVLTYLQTAIKRNENEFDAAKMVGMDEEADIIARLQELSTWLKNLDCYHGDKVNEHSDMLEVKVVNVVADKVEEAKKKKADKKVQITLRPHVLYRPLVHQGTLIPDNSAQHRLLDRIVNVRDGYTVPLGLRGTIIGIHKQPGQDALFDVIFDEEFLGGLEFGGRCPKRRGYRMPECAMVNISHGGRISSRDHKPMAVVRPHNKQFTKQAWQSNAQNLDYPQRNQRSSNTRDHSPRYLRSSNETRTQSQHNNREFQRPVSTSKVQQGMNRPTIMQRPNANTGGKQDARHAKGNQQQGDIFHTLWNTLKEQNKNPNVSKTSATTASSKSKGSATNSQPNLNDKAVPNITAPNAKELKNIQGKNGNITSLMQAAKSLPQVQPDSVKSKSTSEETTKKSTITTTANVQSDKRNTKLQHSTTLTTTVTQSTSTPGADGVDHLNKLFKSIKVPHPNAPPFIPKLAFTPTQPFPQDQNPRNHTQAQQSSASNTIPQPQAPPFVPSRGWYPHYSGAPINQPPPSHFPPGIPPYRQRGPPPQQQFLRGYPGPFNARPMTRNFRMQMQQPPFFPWPGQPGAPTQDWRQTEAAMSVARNYEEGTQKLCEMLNKENEDASSSKWSTGEEEDKLTKRNMAEETLKNKDENEIINKFDSISIKEETSDVDSVKDDEEYMERSTSVEDNSVVKKQTKVDELISMCTKCSMLPPIYTYFTTGDEQVVSTVQLWNGVRFSSHAQLTRDKAMEEAAGQAIGYLKNEQRDKRPVSTSPPSTVPYYLPVQNLLPPQYYQTHAAYGTPVSYATTAPQTFFLPSVPYTMIQQPPVVTIPPEYQHAAYLQQYRFDQAAQYSPYHQHYPTVRVQISPSHQQRYHHHSPGAKPVLWTGLQHDPYQVQEKLSSQRKTTEYKLLDKPPSPVDSNQTKESISEQETLEKTPETSSESEKTTPNKSRPGSAMKKQTAAKPKLAISFNKNQSS
uniref:5'-3' exoribonuclease 1-like isoform X1 n=1 Tax=Styela clava TaxID=7725 RepID=UPI001939A393|nr:5'-3' exoribonuclease 1-like isoform X1 [Styela clava]